MSERPSQDEILWEMNSKVTEIHTAVLTKGGLRDQVADHEARIRVAEQTASESKGGWKILALLTTSGGALGAWIASLIHGGSNK